MGRISSVVGFVLLWAACSVAQAQHVSVFAGYSYINQDFSLTKPSGGFSGWNAAATFKMAHYVGFVADFAGYYPGYNFGCTGCGQSAKIHTFLFGPQVSVPIGRITPFGRFLFGDTHLTTAEDGIGNVQTFMSNNSFTYGAGGGADVGLTHHFAVRGQVDWLHNGFQTSDDQRTRAEIHNIVRISTGIVFRF
jgi:opacity protein-like surface antigen